MIYRFGNGRREEDEKGKVKSGPRMARRARWERRNGLPAGNGLLLLLGMGTKARWEENAKGERGRRRRGGDGVRGRIEGSL